MKKILAVHAEKCTACRLCELVCSFHKTGTFNPFRSRIAVVFRAKEFAYFPQVCTQCDEAPCVRACPSEALLQDPITGIVKLDEQRCVGCMMCVHTCPFGVMFPVPEKACVEKCDCCDGDPVCVRYCFFGALEYREAETVPTKKSTEFASRMRKSYKHRI
jgi:Fe-S-cluster-containing hydrogenase component 2